jgi:hypothetical protein
MTFWITSKSTERDIVGASTIIFSGTEKNASGDDIGVKIR